MPLGSSCSSWRRTIACLDIRKLYPEETQAIPANRFAELTHIFENVADNSTAKPPAKPGRMAKAML